MRLTLCIALTLAVAPALAESGSAGNWTYSADFEPDGSGIVTALSPAPAADYNEPNYAVARCFGGRSEFMVGTNGGWGLSGQTLEVTAQIDDGPAAKARWDVSSNGKAVFVPDQVEAFLKSIPDPGKLRITVRDSTGENRETIFDMKGFSQVRAKIAQACRWKP